MNAVFLHIPKTAGTYIMFALQLKRYILPKHRKLFQNEGKICFGHQDYLELMKKGIVSQKFNNTAFKFTFCRNPFDRVVSHYFYTRLRHPDILPRDVSFIDYTRNFHTYKRLPRHRGRIGGKLAFRPQVDPIKGIKLDFIGRYETLQRDLQKVSKIIGSPIVETDRRNSTSHKHYSHYYNDESVENVKKFYAEDFEFFGYEAKL